VDADVPDNYVQYTLKKEKGLPPVRWNNLLNELNWLNVIILGLTPILGVIGLYYTKLQWKTALFASFYYYVTGLGMPYWNGILSPLLTMSSRYHCGVPSLMGTSLVQRVEAASIFPRCNGRWFC